MPVYSEQDDCSFACCLPRKLRFEAISPEDYGAAGAVVQQVLIQCVEYMAGRAAEKLVLRGGHRQQMMTFAKGANSRPSSAGS